MDAITLNTTLAPIAASAAYLPLLMSVRMAVRLLIRVYSFMIVAWAILSWIDHSGGWLRDIHRVLDAFVSPYVGLLKRLIPLSGSIDFSPIVALLVLQMLLWLI
jgi:uncharacterized protein YggT (Ycf19 family)